MSTKLSPHFTLEELCATQHRRIDNRPKLASIIDALRATAANMELVRAILGDLVVTVSSGFRCLALNRAIRGAKASAHLSGLAVDFNCYGFGSPLAVCRAIAGSGLPFDQLIEEGSWVHISFDPRMRRQILTKRPGGGYTAGLRQAA